MLRVVYACVALLLLAPQSWAQTLEIKTKEGKIVDKVAGIYISGTFDLLISDEINGAVYEVKIDKGNWVENGSNTNISLSKKTFKGNTKANLKAGTYSIRVRVKLLDSMMFFYSNVVENIIVPGGEEAPPPPPPGCPPPCPFDEFLEVLFRCHSALLHSIRIE